MEKRINLKKIAGTTRIWIRPLGEELQAKYVDKELKTLAPGDALIIDAKDVEVFDGSFANAFFSKTVLDMANHYPNRFFIVENLNEYTRHNLWKDLKDFSLIMIERENSQLKLLGKIHPADSQTFDLIKHASKPLTAIELKDKLNINLTAVNERLSKLTEYGVVRRDTGISEAGRQQYIYSGPRL